MPYETVELITTGAHSGLERRVPIWAHWHADGWFVVGSNWGRSHQAGWFHNLRANPAAYVIQGAGEPIPVQARLAEGEQRELLLSRAMEAHPGYADLLERARPRLVPVLVLERKRA